MVGYNHVGPLAVNRRLYWPKPTFLSFLITKLNALKTLIWCYTFNSINIDVLPIVILNKVSVYSVSVSWVVHSSVAVLLRRNGVVIFYPRSTVHPSIFHRNIFQMYYVPRTNEVTTSAISLSLANLVKVNPLTIYPSISVCPKVALPLPSLHASSVMVYLTYPSVRGVIWHNFSTTWPVPQYGPA